MTCSKTETVNILEGQHAFQETSTCIVLFAVITYFNFGYGMVSFCCQLFQYKGRHFQNVESKFILILLKATLYEGAILTSL